MDITQVVKLITNRIPATQAVYLFGSFARGEERADSDVDLAVLLPPEKTCGSEPVAPEDKRVLLGDLAVDLESMVGRRVDLVDLRTVPTVLQKEVVAGGRRVFTGDERAAEEFEMLTFSYYQKLNEERRGILEAFRRTGRAVPL